MADIRVQFANILKVAVVYRVHSVKFSFINSAIKSSPMFFYKHSVSLFLSSDQASSDAFQLSFCFETILNHGPPNELQPSDVRGGHLV